MPNKNQFERYERQVKLKEFGGEAQQRLLEAKVLVVGAGGLGCPVLQYLVAAGVGTIGIVDDDVVALNNLHRQVLYGMDDIGKSKAQVAARKLQLVNNQADIRFYAERLTVSNALSIISAYDIVVDGTDNFSSRYMINDACVLLVKPLIYGAISKFEGQIAVLNVTGGSNRRATNYRDLFPELKDGDILNCAEAGVLGVLPGIIGVMMANETIKLITGTGRVLVDRMIAYNALDNSVYEFGLSLNERAQDAIPKDEITFQRMNYAWLCSGERQDDFEIDAVEFGNFIDDEKAVIIDVREKNEQPLVNSFEHLQIPMAELKANVSLIKKDKVVVFCKSGIRSSQAVKMLREMLKGKMIHSLRGGIGEWQRHVVQVHHNTNDKNF